MNAAKHREYEEESSSVVSNVISFVAGGAVVGSIWALNHFFGNKETGTNGINGIGKVAVPEEVEKLYKNCRNKTENADEIALIDAVYNYLKYSFENAFVKLEKVAGEITDEELNKIFEKSAEYKYFGKLKLVKLEDLKNHFKENHGNGDHSKGYIYQLGYADGFLVEVVAPYSNCELVQEFVKKLLSANKYSNGHMFREDISDWFEYWRKGSN